MTIRGTLIAAAAMALLTAACSGNDAATTADASEVGSTTTTVAMSTTTTTAAPTTLPPTTSTTSPTTTTTTEPRCTPSPLEGAAGAGTGDGETLPPGCYSTQRWGREVVVEIADPGVALFEFPYTFGFAPLGAEPAQGDIVLMAQFTGVIPADQIGSHPPHDEPIGDHMIDVPSDLSTWIESAPQLVVTDSGAYTIEGGPATWWDIEVDPSAGDTFSCPYGDCVATLVPSPPDEQGTNFVMGNTARFRIVQLSGTGEGLFFWIQAAPEDFTSTTALADDVINTLRIDS